MLGRGGRNLQLRQMWNRHRGRARFGGVALTELRSKIRSRHGEGFHPSHVCKEAEVARSAHLGVRWAGRTGTSRPRRQPGHRHRMIKDLELDWGKDDE